MDAVEAATIRAESSINITTYNVTTSSIIGPADRMILDVSMEMAATTLVATTEVVVVMEVALVLSAALPASGQAMP